MENSYYLLEQNYSGVTKHPQIFGNTYLLRVSSETIYMWELESILNKLAVIAKMKKVTNIVIASDKIQFADKLIYILFECTIYSLITKYKKRVYLQCENDPFSHILTAGIENSLIYKMAYDKIKNDAFKEEFKKNVISRNHFRKIVDKNVPNDYFSKLMGDIKSFFRNSFIYNKRENVEVDRVYIDNVTNVIMELVQNANEHSNSDCLIDIDLSGDWYRPKNEKKKFLTINLIVLNFSKTLLGDAVKKKILKSYDDEEQGKYYQANVAYRFQRKYHKKRFNEDVFFDVMTFQNGISGRKNTVTGGTGLPSLLRFIVSQSEIEYCYMFSGRRGLKLGAADLNVSEKWIGFNKQNDILQPPDEEFIEKNNLFFPGCAFSLNLTLEQEGLKG